MGWGDFGRLERDLPGVLPLFYTFCLAMHGGYNGVEYLFSNVSTKGTRFGEKYKGGVVRAVATIGRTIGRFV